MGQTLATQTITTMAKFGAQPARLLRKECLVEAVRGDDAKWWDRLPVHTLTFADPGLDLRIDAGDVVKVIVASGVN